MLSIRPSRRYSKETLLFLAFVGFMLLIIRNYFVGTTVTPQVISSTKEQIEKKKDNDNTFVYFAYGSDLLQARLQAGGGPSAKLLGVGSVTGRKFAFSQESKVWRGGVADIVPSDNSIIYGGVYRLKQEDLVTLDKQKGVDKADPLYERIKLSSVKLKETGEKFSNVISYAIVEDKRLPFEASPSPQYKQCLIKGAEELNLPDYYIESAFRKVKDNGSTYKRKNVC